MARKYTRRHDVIQSWIEARAGQPARVRGTSVLRVAFGTLPPTWETLEWPAFFDAFDADRLAFLYEEQDGSRICKLVKGHTVGDLDED
ncbi:MAG: hypothetical protein IT305_25675 [Chloroflexi bacterium]|nr:hypothetical protein [Chloroflexota bacterium]